MGKATSLEERVKMFEMSQQNYSDREIAVELNISISTVRKWRRRGAKEGRSGLVSFMGRPSEGSLSSFPSELEQRLLSWRNNHPGWGGKTLLAELKRDPYWKDEPLPSLSSINCWLRHKKLTREYSRHNPLPETESGLPNYAHEEWEMDARGHGYVPEIGVISLIDLNDCFSHIRLLSYPCWLGQNRLGRYPNTEDYQVSLRLAFIDWGLPSRLALDHDSVFYDNDTPSPFPTRFHLWLISLGIDLTFGRKGMPTDQAVTERSHQLWFHQVLEAQRFKSIDQLFGALYQRRDFLNNHLPCASTQHLPPLKAHPQARRSRQAYHPQWEDALMDLQRVYTYLAKGRWFRKVSKNGKISLGSQVYYLYSIWKHQQVEITFDPENQQFICHNELGNEHKAVSIKGCSKQQLMGEAGALIRMPNLQLHFPFDYKEWRQLQILEPKGVVRL